MDATTDASPSIALRKYKPAMMSSGGRPPPNGTRTHIEADLASTQGSPPTRRKFTHARMTTGGRPPPSSQVRTPRHARMELHEVSKDGGPSTTVQLADGDNALAATGVLATARLDVAEAIPTATGSNGIGGVGGYGLRPKSKVKKTSRAEKVYRF